MKFMNLYHFKTFRTSYYFPSFNEDSRFLYGLYTPFGRGIAKVYWKLFCSCRLVQILNKVSNPDSVFPYSSIMALMPKDVLVSFNMGTPGPEQKISMLGIETNGNHFFAKYSTKKDAMALSRNEIIILTKLKGTNLSPDLLIYKDNSDYVFFRTTCVEGKSPTTIELDDNIVDLAISINRIDLQNRDLKTSLSHGDFTPWNLIITHEGKYKMIDWELACERELGYDLFTYIMHVGTLLMPNTSFIQLIEKNLYYIHKYFNIFGIKDWKPYLKAFARRRIEYDMNKCEYEHAKKFECLL